MSEPPRPTPSGAPGAPDPVADDLELRKLIESGSRDAREAADSTILLHELRSRRHAIGGSAALPASDPTLDTQILSEAKRRSAQISHAGSSSRRISAKGRPISWWIWALWLLAIAAAVAAWVWLD